MALSTFYRSSCDSEANHEGQLNYPTYNSHKPETLQNRIIESSVYHVLPHLVKVPMQIKL
jgi:hypothetical protein